MLCNSYEFIFLFLPVSLAVYYLLNRMRLTTGANAWLLFVSLFFYSWWDVSYLPLILGSILLIWFPLRGRRLAQMQADVLDVHAAKRAQFDAMEGAER